MSAEQKPQPNIEELPLGDDEYDFGDDPLGNEGLPEAGDAGQFDSDTQTSAVVHTSETPSRGDAVPANRPRITPPRRRKDRAERARDAGDTAADDTVSAARRGIGRAGRRVADAVLPDIAVPSQTPQGVTVTPSRTSPFEGKVTIGPNRNGSIFDAADTAAGTSAGVTHSESDLSPSEVSGAIAATNMGLLEAHSAIGHEADRPAGHEVNHDEPQGRIGRTAVSAANNLENGGLSSVSHRNESVPAMPILGERDGTSLAPAIQTEVYTDTAGQTFAAPETTEPPVPPRIPTPRSLSPRRAEPARHGAGVSFDNWANDALSVGNAPIAVHAPQAPELAAHDDWDWADQAVAAGNNRPEEGTIAPEPKAPHSPFSDTEVFSGTDDGLLAPPTPDPYLPHASAYHPDYDYLFRPGPEASAPAYEAEPIVAPEAVAETTAAFAPLALEEGDDDIGALLDGEGSVDSEPGDLSVVEAALNRTDSDEDDPDDPNEEEITYDERVWLFMHNGWDKALRIFKRKKKAESAVDPDTPDAGEHEPSEPEAERPRGRRRRRIIAGAIAATALAGGLAFGLTGDSHEGPVRGHVAAAAPAHTGHQKTGPASAGDHTGSSKPKSSAHEGAPVSKAKQATAAKERLIHAGNEDLKVSADGHEVTITLDRGGTYWDGISQAEHALHLNADNEHVDEAVQSMHLKPGQDRKMNVGSHKTFTVTADGKLVAKK